MTPDPNQGVRMSSVSKTTRRREIFCVVIFLTLVSILYQCYANISFRSVDKDKTPTKSSNVIVPGCPASGTEHVHDTLIFPALQNFSVHNSIGPRFGQFPLSTKELLKINNFTDRQLFAFMPAMTQPEKLVSLFVFQKFINICSQNNITFFIQGGTLLGSYRHHGFVPWDDDIDVYVNTKDRKKLFCSLKKASPMFDIRQYPRFQWKFYYTKTPTLKAYRYRWPFVDIFFFSVEGDNIFDVTSGQKNHAFKYHNVFPLGTSLFEGAFLPAPCNPKMSINAIRFRGLGSCHTGTYIHKLERSKNNMIVMSLPCKSLYGIYPFVFRTNTNVSRDRVEEVLKVRSEILHSVIVNIGCSVKKATP